MEKHREHLDRSKVRYINFISLIFGFTDAFFAYVLSTYFSRLIGSDNVGGFYLVTFGIIFVSLWKMHWLLRKLGGSVRAFFLFILLAIMLSAAVSRLPVEWFSAALVILLLISTNIAWVALDVILESYSEDGVTGSVRGLYLAVMNTGILLAPFLSTQVLGTYDFSGIFFGMTFGYSVLLIAAILLLRNGRELDSARMDAGDAWRKMLRKKNLLRIYGVSFALEFFYVIMIIYTPIYLRSIGISWEVIGILFTVMLLPFVILQYPLGIIADKCLGEKELLIAGLGITAVSAFMIGIFPQASLLFFGVILFLSRVGAADIEVLRDSYFYKQIDGGDDDLISFFRTARPAANIVAAIVTIPFLATFPLQTVFFLVSLVSIAAIYVMIPLGDTESEYDRRIGAENA